MQPQCDLLIVGAGPFGLAMSAYARHLGIDHLVLGEPMHFWRTHMPKRMYLRSACDWHLDPLEVHTMERFLQERGTTAKEVEPLSLEVYLAYAAWFQQRKQIETQPWLVERLDFIQGSEHPLRATTAGGRSIAARRVLLALGFKHFKHLPPELVEQLPGGRYSHTCDLVDFRQLQHQRCLIIGGRQSAFEWAALASEAGARCVHLSFRHDAPAFAASDWSWVNPLVDAMVENPAWYRKLPEAEKEALGRRFWAEGRLKLEPWLKSRIASERITLWPRTRVVACCELPGGELAVSLDCGTKLTVDHVVLATGYKVSIEQVPLLAHGSALERLVTRNGYPVLDDHFQTSVPGLFITSMPASQDYGPFFAFTVSVRASAKIIGEALVN
ncbi:MAG: NAD(P)-binding domain-containing protein [Rhodopirellula sp.]|nr:NAD(P)-binding domain-containing protein [Rhodopirellula sp.]